MATDKKQYAIIVCWLGPDPAPPSTPSILWNAFTTTVFASEADVADEMALRSITEDKKRAEFKRVGQFSFARWLIAGKFVYRCVWWEMDASLFKT